MADLNRHILRFDRRCRRVDDVEVLAQPDEVLEIDERSGAATLVQVGDVGRAGNGEKRHRSSAHDHLAFGVSCRDVDSRGSSSEGRLDGVSRNADHCVVARLADLRSSGGEDGAGLREENAEPVFLEEPKGRQVKMGDLVV